MSRRPFAGRNLLFTNVDGNFTEVKVVTMCLRQDIGKSSLEGEEGFRERLQVVQQGCGNDERGCAGRGYADALTCDTQTPWVNHHFPAPAAS